ncbi:MAG: hypothetical protein IJ795_03390 [Bacteroidales bacterium]|nr:hypothetical protein [Bacteroidales bacterium]
MSCFIVPLVEAVAVTAVRKHSKGLAGTTLGRNLPALEKMLWGGSLMLVVDHVLSGELTWRFPFLTALSSVGGGMTVLRELLTVGLPMALVLTAAWAIYYLVKERGTALAHK